jgi:hypothetical protein
MTVNGLEASADIELVDLSGLYLPRISEGAAKLPKR